MIKCLKQFESSSGKKRETGNNKRKGGRHVDGTEKMRRSDMEMYRTVTVACKVQRQDGEECRKTMII